MIFIDFLFAFLIALLIASALSALFGGRGVSRVGTWPVFLFLFLILLPMTWAGGIWIAPFGPVLWDGYWLPFVAVGILVALMMAALAPPSRRPSRSVDNPEEPVHSEEIAALAVGIFFWLVLLGLVVAIYARYA